MDTITMLSSLLPDGMYYHELLTTNGWKLSQEFTHDEFLTKRYLLNNVCIELTFENDEVKTCEVMFPDIYREIAPSKLVQLSELFK